MSRIFGFIGSPLKRKSNTYRLTMMMLEILEQMGRDITHEILTAGHVKLNYCQGCWTCMTENYSSCPQDRLDDMAILKQKMEAADFLILGSPVHTAHMSGQMKTYFDRLSAWYHIFKLAGKPGLTVVTTGSVHQEELHDFMGMLMGCLGIKVVARLDAVGFSPGVFMDEVEARKNAEETANIIYPYMTGEKKIETDQNMERCFQAMKDKVLSGEKWLAGYKYWKENGMLELNSYAELLEKIEAGCLGQVNGTIRKAPTIHVRRDGLLPE